MNSGRGVVAHDGCIIEEDTEAACNAFRVINLLGRFIETIDPQVCVIKPFGASMKPGQTGYVQQIVV